MEKLICFTGPTGTSDHRAIRLFSSVDEYEPLPMPSISEVIQTVNYTAGCFGVVPMENSTDGELTTILDRLIFETTQVRIQEEVVLAEGVSAFGLTESDSVATVISHPLILELCSRFIKERGLLTRHALSTSDACRSVVLERDPTMIALAPPEVGVMFELKVMDEGVLDVPEIRTRYALIGQGIAPRTTYDKTSLVITPTADKVGSLSEISTVFASHGVNMVSILSRPLQAKIGLHAFYVVCEGHVSESGVYATLKDLIEGGSSIKLLGSFPRWRGTEVTTPFASLPMGFAESTAELDQAIANPHPVSGNESIWNG